MPEMDRIETAAVYTYLSHLFLSVLGVLGDGAELQYVLCPFHREPFIQARRDMNGQRPAGECHLLPVNGVNDRHMQASLSWVLFDLVRQFVNQFFCDRIQRLAHIDTSDTFVLCFIEHLYVLHHELKLRLLVRGFAKPFLSGTFLLYHTLYEHV